MTSVDNRSKGYLNRGWAYRDRIQRDAHGLMVLEFYVQRYSHSSREVWRQRIEAGLVRLEERPARADERLETGQVLTYFRPPWLEAEVPRDIEILHEDAHLIAVAKPSGLPTLPGGDFLENTLLFLLRQRYSDAPAPVHRLGRGTSGLVLFARSQTARRQLSADLQAGRLTKIYRALVDGIPAADEFIIEVPIGRVPYPPLGYVHATAADGKPARTECRILERRSYQTLLQVAIPTGRSHQIRIHLAAAGHPLWGDPLYRTGGQPLTPPTDGRAPLPGDCGYHLHATQVSFAHPNSGVRMTITCPPPEILR